MAATKLVAGDVLKLLAARGIPAAERSMVTDPEQPFVVTTDDKPGSERVVSITIQFDGE